ncbi:MAG: S8 family serine peptidase [Elainella sp. Prado103]|nr:S8 family serine peptidase [Elainella sp. Prado103]
MNTFFPSAAASFKQKDKSEKISGSLRKLYDQYVGGEPIENEELFIFKENKNKVNIQLTTNNANQLLGELGKLDFELVSDRSDRNFLEGFIKINKLRKLDELGNKGLLGALPSYRPVTAVGSVTSQADFVLSAERVRNTLPFGYDGTGVRVGIMSDSFNISGDGSTAADIASGDLPAAGVTILQEGPGGSIDEGRAMAQLVHDLAPGAALAFSSVFFGQANFAQQIRDLADPTKGNAQILTDDVFYFAEPMFQDGVIAQAIDEVVTTRGVSYFALAGNLSRQGYETTTFNGVGDASLNAILPFSLSTSLYHDFDSGSGVDLRQQITLNPGQRFLPSLQWNDPFYTTNGVDTDLDFYLLNGNAIVASSNADSIVNQTPSEIFSYTNTGSTPINLDVVIQLYAGPAPDRMKYVNMGANNTGPITSEYPLNAPTVIPHSTVGNARSVAAVPYFNQDIPESYTSQGPATILFNPDGTPKAAPEIRQKPDFAAIDGTDTTFFGGDADGNGFPNFFGTSAAAPHAAAIAALIKQANPTFTPQQIYNRMASTAEDIGAPGFDIVTGAGIIDAYRAIFGSVVPAAGTFADGFETGVLSSAYATDASGTGRIRVVGSNGPIGTRHLVMDSSVNSGIPSLNEVILSLNLTTLTNVQLSFAQKELGAEVDQSMPLTFSGSNNSDGVALSVDGLNWYRLVDLTGANSTNVYQTQSINLTTFAANNGLTLGSNVSIKFQQFANNTSVGTGFAFDSLSVIGDPVINGTPGNDVLVGGVGNDTINGLGGNDNLNGGFGDDNLFGGAGNDLLDGDFGFDLLNGGAGNDTTTYAFYFGSINANLATGVVSFPGGGFLTDTLVSIENLVGAAGNDVITGNGVANTLSGNTGDDRISGGNGNDILNGDSGIDRLNGGSGNDILTGGTENDRFIFSSSVPFTITVIGLDTITDFVTGDKIVLDKTTFSSLTSSTGTGFSVATEFARVTNDAAVDGSTALIVYNRNNGKLFYNSDGAITAAGNSVQFAVLTGNPFLGSNSFILQA